ncbi:hypothetical protein HEB29_004970 [Streptomyces fulvorobeus]|uniref:Uncharacterized protein n=1 Tax=Streptomyces fulvorobeus TaxID=284028 RepID=A0A7Y9HH38_9ACTN|nr:hypothetical protein [Streptomyces fulvorobeus]
MREHRIAAGGELLHGLDDQFGGAVLVVHEVQQREQ